MAGESTSDEPVLLSGGNPQIAKGDGREPVEAYLAAMPEWKRDVGVLVDRLVTDVVPDVRQAVRWNSPFYGVADRGWFLSLHCLNKAVKVTFFNGSDLDPEPPGSGKDPRARWVDIDQPMIDDKAFVVQLSDWIIRAANLPGWDGF